MVRTQLSRKSSANIRRRSFRSNSRQGGNMPKAVIKAIDDVKKTYNVKLLNRQTGEEVRVEVPQDATIRDFKNRIADQLLIQNRESIKLSLDFDEASWSNARLNDMAWHYSIPLNFDYENKNEEEKKTTSKDEGDDY